MPEVGYGTVSSRESLWSKTRQEKSMSELDRWHRMSARQESASASDQTLVALSPREAAEASCLRPGENAFT